MSTLQQLREGLNEAWDTLLDGWQRLYRRAAGALTRFTPGGKAKEGGAGESHEIALRNTGWGLLASEVFDDDDKVVVRLEAPGMEKSDFDIQVLEDYLVVRGEKQLQRERTQGRYHVTECAYGSFERAIPLPEEVEAGKASATYKNGVLRIELPKTASRRRKTIKVDVK
ncbi:MAG TPA: Hsp20/alpha crystallin family protein [Sedimenticola sp.]|nr:Hsp20/alpha crystallin family protein [Sedimenticola sp.]